MKRKTIWSVLLVLLIVLSGCGGRKSEESSEVIDQSIAGKIYYNTVNEYGNEDHSWIRLEKDGTFTMVDNLDHGRYEIAGRWSVKKNVCTLRVGEEGVTTSSSRYTLEIKDDNNLILKNDIGGSKAEQIFSTDKSGWSTYNKADLPADAEPGEEGGEESGTPSGERIRCIGIETEYKSYWANAGTKPWNLDVVVTPKNTTDKIIYKSNDESVVKVDEEGNVSAISPGNTTIDISCGDQKLTIKFETR